MDAGAEGVVPVGRPIRYEGVRLGKFLRIPVRGQVEAQYPVVGPDGTAANLDLAGASPRPGRNWRQDPVQLFLPIYQPFAEGTRRRAECMCKSLTSRLRRE